jgi:glutamate/tyrosine decarboxylase-like PLP-dependent enzyme
MKKDCLPFALERALAFATASPDRPVSPDAEALAGLAAFDEPWPDHPADGHETLAMLDSRGSPATVATTGGRYFGFVTGGVLPAALAADWLVSAWDQPAALPVMSPAVARIETIAARWVLEALDLPRSAAVAFPTGASQGNIVALAAARRAVLLRQGHDVEEAGLRDSPPIRVIISDEAHSTLIKGLGILGLGRKAVETVPTDSQGRMRLDALPALDDRTILCVQAGNVNSGASDPLRPLAEKARAAGAWLHVDGAFGLWARACSRLAHQLDGVELADSWVTDGHKWLNTPYDGGIVICRDTSALVGAMSFSAAYMPQDEAVPQKDMLMEFSRRARGVPVWAALRSLGRSGLDALVDRTCRHAERLAEALAAHGFTIHNEVALNQVVVSCGTPEATDRVREHVCASGFAWFGPTRWRGHHAFRISVSSWATGDGDIDALIAALLDAKRATA